MQWPLTESSDIEIGGWYIGVRDWKNKVAEIDSVVDSFEFNAATDLLERGDRALIAGCGMGSIATWVASYLGVDNVIAYEPNPLLHEFVLRNVRVGGRALNVVNAAIDQTSGIRDMMVADHWSRSSLVMEPKSEWGPQKVKTVGLNRAIQSFGATALLLDIEGSEMDCFPNLNLNPIRIIVTEVHGGDDNLNKVVTILEENGFELKIKHFRHPAKWLHIIGAVRDRS